MLHRSFKLEILFAVFLLKISLIHLGASPDVIGKISWPLKEAILEVQTFSLNLNKSESKLLEVLEASIFIQYASVIPFWKPLDRLILEIKSFLTSEVSRGHQRLLKMKKMILITFFEDIWRTPNLKLKPPGYFVGDPWKKISWMRPRKPFFRR